MQRDPQAKLDWLRASACIQVDICVDWPWYVDSIGYGQVYWLGAKTSAHRVVCEMVHGPCPPGKEAAHSCGRRNCTSGRHLRWDTRAANLADRVAHGTDQRGERSTSAKLTAAEVHEIRTIGAAVPQRELARRYGVNQSQICMILRRKTWAHEA